MSDDIFRRFKAGRGGSKPSTDSARGVLGARQATAGSRQRIQEAELLAAVDRIPALPAVVTQILGKVGDEATSAGDMEGLIQQDMVIAGRLLKLVNSPFYNLPNEITSITQAVAIIGFGSMRSLVLAASASQLLDVSIAAYGYQGSGLWTNSLVTASLAQDIARHAGCSRELADEFLVAGLLRDVGVLVIGPFLDREGVRLRAHGSDDDDIITAERAAIGFDHCWAGERVADKWQLPPRLRTVIARHHRIPADASEEALRLLAGVRLAERLAFRAQVGLEADHPFDCEIDATLLGASGIDGATLKELIAKVPDVIAQAEEQGL